jgi:spore coat protein U-like protein
MRKQMGRLMAGATMAVVVAGVASYSQQQVGAASATPVNVAVSASVAANCVLTAGSLDFGAYDPLGANDTADLDQAGSFAVKCVKGSAAQLGLGQGANYSAGRRLVSGGTNYLNYELYKDAGRSTVWTGVGAGRLAYTATTKAEQTISIYGRVTGGQDAAAGSYTDTVVATADF